MTKLNPLQNIVIVEKEEDEKTSKGGIHLPQVDKDKPRIGTVLAVGPGVYTEEDDFVEPGVKVGDRIAYQKAHEKTFTINNEEVTCVIAAGILGILVD